MTLFRRSRPPRMIRPPAASLDQAESVLRNQGPTWRVTTKEGRTREIDLDERRAIAGALMELRISVDEGRLTDECTT